MAYRFIASNENIFAFLAARESAILSQVFEQAIASLGKVIRVDSIKLANKVRAHAGTRR